MLNEKFVSEIAGLSAAKTPLEKIDQYTRAFRKADGDLVTLPLQPKPKTSTVYRIDDLVENLKSHPTNGKEIFYSRDGVRGFYDYARRASVTMLLTPSKPFEQLEAWDGKPEQIPQAALFLLLKTTFRGCCDELLERVVKSIKWTMGNNGESTVRQGSVSMNKSIIAEMTGADDLNKIEYVTFDVPVFLELPNVKARIECHIRPIPESQMFSVIPTGGHIEAAYRLAEDTMRTMILSAVGEQPPTKDQTPEIFVFHGTAEADNEAAARLS